MFDDLLNDIEKDISGDWNLIQDRIKEKNINNFFDDIHDVMDNIVKITIRNREINKDLKDIIGSHYYLREYCTVRFGCGRQTGKTEWIKRRIEKDDVIVVMKEGYKKRLIYEGVDKRNIITASSVKNGSYRGRVFRNIYIDDASLVDGFITDKDLYIELGRVGIDQLFIFIG